MVYNGETQNHFMKGEDTMGVRLSEEAKNWLKTVDYENRTPFQRRVLLEAARILYPYKKEK